RTPGACRFRRIVRVTMEKLVQPRLDTPPPTAPGHDTPHALPHTLVSEHVERLAVAAAIGAGLWAYGVVMDTVVRPMTMHTAVPVPSVVVEAVAIAASLLLLFYVRYTSDDAVRKTDAGLWYVVLNAAAVALINATTGLAERSGGRGLSWNTVVILV